MKIKIFNSKILRYTFNRFISAYTFFIKKETISKKYYIQSTTNHNISTLLLFNNIYQQKTFNPISAPQYSIV